MEVFYSNDISDGRVRLSPEESAHCVKVLRHRVGDEIFVSGGDGNLYRCSLVEADPREAVAQVLSVEGGFGMHPYRLWMAVAPTKNIDIDRFEWFTEKAVEMGVDRITPLLCAHSERRVFNRDRGQRIVVSAAKQSLKGVVPQLDGLTSFKDMMAEIPDFAGRKFIAYCDSDIASGLNTRKSLAEALDAVSPEGDFSSDEIAAALTAGFTPLSLGPSRLRTETAAVLCVSALYTALSCV